MKTPLSLSLCLTLLVACGARRIPGTEIEDNDDTRAILKVMEQYRAALEARDAEGVLKLLSDSFKDEGGSSKMEDRMDLATLQKKLPAELAKVEDVKLDLSVRKIEIFSETSTASAVYTYNLSFRMPRLNNKPQSESEIKQMWFKRDKGQWKISSGI
ncbi:MAG TPA: nuclear transport factor 2 family protein [Myxococcaceae bacterium]|nr:nuclear transport factor 2 family protein [Myxococcaceae bacterium]